MRTSTLPRLTLVLSLVALCGLAFGVTVRAEAKKPRAAKPSKTSAPDCKKDEDCILVSDDCCSCNQGGKARAIPKKQKDAYEKERKKRCAGTECIEMMSQDPSCSQHPFCGAGICELGDAPGGDSAPAP